jgi:hypothetical protein
MSTGDKEMYAKQWYSTDHIAAKVADDENRPYGDISISWKPDDGQGDANLCKDLTGVGTTLVSAVSGIGTAAGFGLALGGLLCKP